MCSSDLDAERLAAELSSLRPASALVLAADVADAEAVRAMMQTVRQQLGGLDFLINNAAILRDRTIAKLSLEEWQAVVDVNLTGVFHCCKFGLEVMRDGGAIVSLGSIAAIQGFFGQANYAAAKAGLIGMSKSLAQELASRSITVNCVAPGFIATPMTDVLTEDQKKMILGRVPAERLGTPDEIAAGVVYLASDEAAYVSGQTLHINGGMAMI